MAFLDGKALRDWCKRSFQLKGDMLKTAETVMENKEEGKSVDALVVKEVFQNDSDGKRLLASAITDKGVSTDAGDSFSVMAENVGKIQGSGQGTGGLKVQRVACYIYNANSTSNIDIKPYSGNYQNLKLNENIFFSVLRMNLSNGRTMQSGWYGPSNYLYGSISYNANTGTLTVRSATYTGVEGWVYIVEAE